MDEPVVVERAEQPYAAISATVPMAGLATELPPLIGEVFGWLAGQGVEPAGPPIWRYRLIDMSRELLVDVGVPVATAVSGNGRIVGGILPAGKYVTVTHVGHPNELAGVTGELLAWAERGGLTWDMTPTDQGERWGCRLEEYLTDPAEEPDMTRWATRLAFRLA
jgi:effector-binding domain-containing protein